MSRQRSHAQGCTKYKNSSDEEHLQSQCSTDRVEHEIHAARGKTRREHPKRIQRHQGPAGHIRQQRPGIVHGKRKRDGGRKVDLGLEDVDARVAPVLLHQPVLVPQDVLQEEGEGQRHARQIGRDAAARFQPRDGPDEEEAQVEGQVRQLVEEADPVEVSASGLVEHPEGRGCHEDEAGPTQEDGAAFRDVHVAEQFGSSSSFSPAATRTCTGATRARTPPRARAGTAVAAVPYRYQLPTSLERKSEEEASEAKEDAGREGMAQEGPAASHLENCVAF